MELLKHHLFVKRDTAERKTTSGIILLTDATAGGELPNTGVIVAAGPGTKHLDQPYGRGQRVQFNPHAPIEHTHEGEDLLLMTADDVYCILND